MTRLTLLPLLESSAYIDSPSFSSNETISVLGSLRKAGSFWASHLRAPTTWRTRASSDDTSRAHLDGHGIFAIIVFAAVSLVVIAPLQIPIPFAVSRPIRRAARRLLGHKQDDDGTAAPTSDAARKRRNSEEDAPEEQTSSPTHVAPDSSSQDVKQAEERTYLPLNHVSAPIIGCLLLLATKTIGGEQVRAGIVGEEGVEPYDVLALFISLVRAGRQCLGTFCSSSID